MSAIVDFYQGTYTDYLGRTLADIWRWDHDRLESIHNYIQVLFPNRQPSLFNARAPLLDDATVEAFQSDPALRTNLGISLDVLLRFYGLEYDEATDEVRRRPDFEERARNWISPSNHNFLRITRILLCLMDLGLPERARAFFRCLEDIAVERRRALDEAFAYWRAAVTPAAPP